MEKRKRIFLTALALLITLCMCGCNHIGDFYFGNSSFDSRDAASAGLTVEIMDVGQADAILIMQDSHAMMVDTATSDQAGNIENVLNNYNVDSLDAMVLTHPHADHIGSAAEIMDSITVGRIFTTSQVNTTSAYERTIDKIDELDIPVTVPCPGDTYNLGEALITFFSPPQGVTYSDINDSSVAFLLEYQGVRMLFTGDMGSDMEELALESGFDVSCDLIKVPHHGSKTASSQDFVDAADADWAIMTTGVDSDDSLPNEEVVNRWEKSGATVLCTSQVGAVVAEVTDGVLSVYTIDE